MNNSEVLEEIIEMLDKADKRKWGELGDIIYDNSELGFINIKSPNLLFIKKEIKKTLCKAS